MLVDSSLAFVPIGAPLSMVGGAGVSFVSNVIDLMGVGVGIAPPNIFGSGNPGTLWGTDFGIGKFKMELAVAVGTAFVTATSATLNVQFQGAPDTATTYQPGTWQTFVETGTLTAAQLTANAIIARFDWPPAFPVTESGERPRYVRLNFSIPSAEDFTAGTIAYALTVPARDDWAIKFQNKNFGVS